MIPSSYIKRLRMPRAQPPLKTLVTAVCSGKTWLSAARWASEVWASSANKNAVPTCTACAPSCMAARTVVASLIPPAATTGRLTARMIWGKSANVPLCVAGSCVKNQPRCPPASQPWAITPSTPCACSHCASVTVVALLHTSAPVALTAAKSLAVGKPK